MIKRLMHRYNCDAILFLDSKNIRYICGFRGDNGMLICTNKEHVLVTDPRFELDAKNTVKNARIVINEKETALWDMPELYKELKIKRMGFSSNIMTVDVYERLKKFMELVPLDIIPSSYRYIKTKDEIRLMKKAIEAQEKAYKEVLPRLAEGISELTFAAELDYRMKLSGAESTAFATIIAFAENSAIIHATPTDKKIKGNGPLIIDFGAVCDGYCSDETVTLLFGKVDDMISNIYDDVYTAQKRAIEAVRPGVKAVQLYDKAYGYLMKKGYGDLIQHSLGHHIGLDIHEYPKIFSFTDFVFEEGMVFTIEPGLYLPRIGGVRIEDMVTVTSTGVEVLTSLPKEKKVFI
ncbi:MAG: Xaa-Pro peptidase family protein [Pseudomonadota bacterium]